MIREMQHTGERSREEMEYERAHRRVAREAAREGIVLLENQGILPLQKGTKVQLLGAGARRTIKGGTGSGDVNERESVSIEEGLRRSGYELTGQKWLEEYDAVYEQARADGMKLVREKEKKSNFVEAFFSTPFLSPDENRMSEQNVEEGDEPVIYVLARISGEGTDRRNEKGDFKLSDREYENLHYLQEKKRDIILVLNTGGMMDLSFLEEFSQIQAVLYLTQGGMEGGNALAEVLSGETNPSGKLTDTWAMQYGDYPGAADFGANNGNLETEEYKEGILVGYRWFDAQEKKVRYPFGYGRSYTEFSIQGKEAVAEEQQYFLRVQVTNEGGRSGKEVVQVYAGMPQNTENLHEKKRLVAFAKTRELAPKESQVLEFWIPEDALSYYDEQEEKWCIDAGSYCFYVGNASDNLQTLLKFEQEKKVIFAEEKKVKRTGEEQSRIEKAARMAEQLTDAELVQLVCGAFGGEVSQLGNAAQSVPGAAGETVGLRHGDVEVANIILVDGPAGLRLSRHYQTSRAGKIYPQTFESMVEGGIFEKPEPKADAVDYYQYCTAFPIGTMLAQTWNLDLITKVGNTVGEELEHFQVTLWLAPGMNIHRNPLCGRNFEYYSEDPYLTGKMAAAMTEGVQAVPGVGTTLKHFACNNQEDNRNHVNAVVGERALREIYLKGFEIAVKEANPYAIMTSYNKINGVHAANSEKLCTKIAREEWGYHGLIMTDWATTLNGAESAGCIRAGNDLIMPGAKEDHEQLKEALAKGTLERGQLVKCASRVIATALHSNRYV